MKPLQWIMTLAALVLLALMSVSPFLDAAMPLTDDGNLHIYRSIVLDDSIRNDGQLYPRFASGLAYGYGAPLFNYFPPTSYYPTVILHAIGLSWVIAWKGTVIFYVMLAALGMYLWAREWVDGIGALVASAGYIYAPYALFDTVTRGSSNEFAGMALLPFALWGFTRLSRYGRRQDYFIAVAAFVLFILAHNVMTLYGTILLIGYCMFLLASKPHPPRAFWQMLTAGVFSMMITAFFWLPALAETDYVKINGVLENLAFVDVTTTLRTMGDVFALPHTADPSRLQQFIPISFHWLLIIPAILGFFLPQPGENEEPATHNMLGLHIFLLLVFAVVVLSQLQISRDLWRMVRLLQYSQFAWRPMSIGSLALALLAGIGTSYLLRLIRGKFTTALALTGVLVLIGLYSVPWLYRPEIVLQANNLADAQAYEIESNQPALSSYGEYLPSQTDASALNPLRFQNNSERIRPSDTYTVTVLSERGTRVQADVTAFTDTVLIADWLYVPGWQARVDGQRVPVDPVGREGVVGINLPAGDHRIEVWYGGTGTQFVSGIVSLLGLLALSGFVYRFVKPVATEVRPLEPGAVALLAATIAGLILFGAKALIIDRVDSPLRNTRFENGVLEGVETEIGANFGNQIQLLGATIDETMPTGGNGTVRLYWSLLNGAIEKDYSTIVQLVNQQGIVIAETTVFAPGGLATRNWLPGYYLEDVVTLEIPPYTPTLTYDVVVGLYESDSGRRLDVINQTGNPTGVEVQADTITVVRHADPASEDELPLPIITASGLDLLEFDGLPEQAQVGEEIIISTLWRAVNPQGDVRIILEWDERNSTVIAPPVIGMPVADWQTGDIWRGYHRFYVPPALAAGDYIVTISHNGRPAQFSHPIRVTTPEYSYTTPDDIIPLEAQWTNGILLLGYTIEDSKLDLYWQTRGTISSNLRLFVQVFDEDRLLLVRDGIPVDGQRPTTSWISGEIIRTSHDLSGASEGTHVLIGWYDPVTGSRVPLPGNAADAFRFAFPSE